MEKKKDNTIEYNYHFYYNAKLINDPQLLKSLIQQIEKYAPVIYNNLIKDKNFIQLLNEINHQTKETPSEIKTNAQQTEFNPQQTNNNLDYNTPEQDANIKILK